MIEILAVKLESRNITEVPYKTNSKLRISVEKQLPNTVPLYECYKTAKEAGLLKEWFVTEEVSPEIKAMLIAARRIEVSIEGHQAAASSTKK